MPTIDSPLELHEQITQMKKYVNFRVKTRMERMLKYAGYFRISRYGKYLISHSGALGGKSDQDTLYALYDFDVALRQILFFYCKKAEVQFKSNLSNAIALKTNNQLFYLAEEFYTPSQGHKDRTKRDHAKSRFSKFMKDIAKREKLIRLDTNKYPELRDYRTPGLKSRTKLPCWVAFSYMDFGNICYIYSYLRGDLRKEVLKYGYSKSNYGKNEVNCVDTWLAAIRNMRNICAHHNKLIGKTSSVVLFLPEDEIFSAVSNTELCSRLYALKKLLTPQDATDLKKDLLSLIKKSKIDTVLFQILPQDWDTIYDSILPL